MVDWAGDQYMSFVFDDGLISKWELLNACNDFFAAILARFPPNRVINIAFGLGYALRSIVVSSGFNVEAMAAGSKSCHRFSGISVRYAEVSFEARTFLYLPVELKLRRFISNYIPSVVKSLL